MSWQRIHSPGGLLTLLVVAVFAIELSVMVAFALLPPMPQWLEILLDASTLVILLFPLLYFALFRPLTDILEQRRVAAIELADANQLLQEDIAIRKLAEEKLHQEKQFSDDIINSLPGIFYMMTDRGQFIRVNEQFVEVTGYTVDDLLRMTALELFAGSDKSLVAAKIVDVLEREAGSFEADLILKNGARLPYYFTGHRTFIHGQAYLVGVGTNISARKALEQELMRQARTDLLTGLFLRRYFFELATQEYSRARRYGGVLSAFMLDLDEFKLINDLNGHYVGDQVLQALGDIFRRTVREVDILGRLGGEEFAVLLPETDTSQALEVAERLRANIENSPIAPQAGTLLKFTASIGVATLNEDDVSVDLLFRRADHALYVAKQSGRNRVCLDGHG